MVPKSTSKEEYNAMSLQNTSAHEQVPTPGETQTTLAAYIQKQVEISKLQGNWIDIRWMIPSIRVQSSSGAGFYLDKEEAKPVLLTALSMADNFDGASAQDCLESTLMACIEKHGPDITKEIFMEQLNSKDKGKSSH